MGWPEEPRGIAKLRSALLRAQASSPPGFCNSWLMAVQAVCKDRKGYIGDLGFIDSLGLGT